MGIADGSAREIAILSRWESRCASRCWASPPMARSSSPGGRPRAEALDYFLDHLRPGDILPSVVQNPASFGTFCDIGCGVTALMSIERCSVSRITHCNQRFSPGQKIYAAILGVDREARRISLTHRELLGTWAENAAGFRAGQAVTGIVRSVQPYGAFIELTPNLSGLAEPEDGPGAWPAGQRVHPLHPAGEAKD